MNVCRCGCPEHDHWIHPDTEQLIDCRRCACRQYAEQTAKEKAA